MQPQEIRPASATPRKRGVAVVSAEVAEMLSTQVRVSGGFTHARGLINPDTGRLSWRMMCGHLGIPRCAVRRHRDSPPPDLPADPKLPTDLAGTTHGRLYAALLRWAEDYDFAPSNEEIAAQIDGLYLKIPPMLGKLEKLGYISRTKSFHGRSILIRATGKMLPHRLDGA